MRKIAVRLGITERPFKRTSGFILLETNIAPTPYGCVSEWFGTLKLPLETQ